MRPIITLQLMDWVIVVESPPAATFQKMNAR
jgi:hypothetical protein